MVEAGAQMDADSELAQGEVVTTARLETFSDGIFAIAATLRVLMAREQLVQEPTVVDPRRNM